MSKQFVTLDQNNRIGYQVYGTGNNTILLFHGLAGGSWLDPKAMMPINEANIRLIALERGGYGDSSQLKLKSVRDWGNIILRVVEELQIDKADVLGISAGAPYAYATAYFLPETIQKIWILAGVPAVYEDPVLGHYSEINQELYKSFVKTDLSQLQKDYLKNMKEALKQFRDSEEKHIIKSFEEIIDQQCYGMALESKLQILPWELDFSAIDQPVTMYHAKEDEMIPFKAAREMFRYLKELTFNELPITGDNVHMKTGADAFLKVLKQYSNL